MNDDQIIQTMKSSRTIQEWNESRESVKNIRDTTWIAKHIDACGLIGKTTIKSELAIKPTATQNNQ